ncbi:MAG: hypothetical protein LC748_09445 [Thermomicrobia bacterium]|nr:hypothetical protein [Thermomicrobia bacterium]
MVLETVLPRIETQFIASLRTLDELLAKPQPGRKDAKRLLAEVPNNVVTLRYFFERNTNPHWLVPLQQQGFFGTPPDAERDDTGAASFPPWPAGNYLARMAAIGEPSVAARVLQIMLDMPDTDNVWVHTDLVTAAVALPPALAAPWAEREHRWMERQEMLSLIVPERLATLIAHLACGDEIGSALDLARALFAILPDSTHPAGSDADETLRWILPRARARIDTHGYARLLGQTIPVLVRPAPDATLGLLVDLLDDAVRLSSTSAERHVERDLSHLWRPAIEDHAQNAGAEYRDILVVAVRDAAEDIVTADPMALPGIVAALEARPWPIFRRIALHLLRRFPQIVPDLIATRLTDYALFDAPDVRHEWTLLLKEHFSALLDMQRGEILTWIEEEADNDATTLHLVPRDTPMANTDIARYRNTRILQRLAPIRNVLPPTWARRYAALVADLGEPEHPEFLSYATSWIGPTSPKTAEELAAMTVTEVVAFLAEWRPSVESWSPSPDGLGRALSAAIAADPQKYAEGSDQFIELEPIYVRALLFGLEQALRHDKPFTWEPVVTLCDWIVRQGDPVAVHDADDPDREPSWSRARGQVADLFQEGLVPDVKGTMPLIFRPRVWAALEPVMRDADPTPAYEARSTMSAAQLALNTTRGKGLLAVVQYALWARQPRNGVAEGSGRETPGFDTMPEVRAVLDRHLTITYEPSLAVRAAYGQCFPLLVMLDEAWTSRQVGRIFPTSPRRRSLHAAAWETYVFLHDPDRRAYPLLREHYARAVERLAVDPDGATPASYPTQRLVRHLILLYWYGVLDLDAGNGILDRFFATASDAVRGYAIELMGRVLTNTEGEVPDDILVRSMRLWEGRLAAAQRADDPASYEREMAAFAWWFYAKKFDDTWALAHLRAALLLGLRGDSARPLARRIGMADLIIERLAAIAAAMPLAAMECLAVVVERDSEGTSILPRESMRAVLTVARASGNDRAARIAADVINRLCARGNFDYRDLLPP